MPTTDEHGSIFEKFEKRRSNLINVCACDVRSHFSIKFLLVHYSVLLDDSSVIFFFHLGGIKNKVLILILILNNIYHFNLLQLNRYYKLEFQIAARNQAHCILGLIAKVRTRDVTLVLDTKTTFFTVNTSHLFPSAQTDTTVSHLQHGTHIFRFFNTLVACIHAHRLCEEA